MKKWNADKFMMGLVMFYIFVPVLMFISGWIKLHIAILMGVVLIVSAVRISRDFEDDSEISITKNASFWLIALAVIAVWTLFSGIGKFGYQTGDFIVRNPMYRDLQLYSWPVVYDMAKEPAYAQKILGDSGNALYVYYFTWWLPPALIGRMLYTITNMSISEVEVVTDIAVYLWAVLGLFLTFYCLVKLLKRYSYLILSTFILFGGLDFVVYYLENNEFPTTAHIEWWAGGGGCRLFQYSANTTQLYWVFNQSIPVWLIVATVLLLKKRRGIAAVASLAFAYSPFATIGIVPIAVAGIFNLKKESFKDAVRKAVSPENILIPLMMLGVFGSFYALVLGKGMSQSGFIFSTDPEFRTFTIYIAFIIVEFLIYYLAMGKSAQKYRFYWVTLVELLMIPMYKMGFNNDFVMRVSIPSLFILMILCLQSLFEKKNSGDKRGWCILLACLVIGYMASVCEIRRNVVMTLQADQQYYINELEYSFGNMRIEDEGQIVLSANQYMAKEEDYKYSVFYNFFLR